MALTVVDGGMLSATNAQYTGFKNRLINGAMVIDQRYAGAAVTPTANVNYIVDRWNLAIAQPSKLTIQQNRGSITPPAGFTNYLGAFTASAYSAITTEYFSIKQLIEGFNVADLGWGTASAQTVTLSFRVYSSLTGTFSGALQNNAASRSYAFTYSVPVANTWTTISVTIAGDTSGTWLTTNGIGIAVCFNLGSGPSLLGTAGSWSASWLEGATGSVAVVANASATFYITGVQLEKGVTATAFDYRPFGTELALCQRYYENSNGAGGLQASNDQYVVTTSAVSSGLYPTFGFRVGKRVAPSSGMTFTFAGGTGATFNIGFSSFYQNTNHSLASTFGWTASAEL